MEAEDIADARKTRRKSMGIKLLATLKISIWSMWLRRRQRWNWLDWLSAGVPPPDIWLQPLTSWDGKLHIRPTQPLIHDPNVWPGWFVLCLKASQKTFSKQSVKEEQIIFWASLWQKWTRDRIPRSIVDRYLHLPVISADVVVIALSVVVSVAGSPLSYIS